MATVDEILDAMTEDADTYAVADDVLLIDPDTRQISVPSSELVFGVEGDAQGERKYFLCSRYVGNGLDLASCFVRIPYRNANGEIDAYLVEDLAVNGDAVTFSWELSPKVTMYRGQVQYLASFVNAATGQEWHTTHANGMVLEGLEPDYGDVEGATTDVVAQLLATVDRQTAAVQAEGAAQIEAVRVAAAAAEQEAVLEVEAKGANTLASIPADYTAVSQAVSALTRGAAPGIVCDAAGEVVSVSDASNQPMAGLRVFGRSTQDGTPALDAPVEIVSEAPSVVKVAGRNLCPPSAFDTMIEVGKNTNTYDAASRTITMIANPAVVAGRYCIPVNDLVVGRSYVVSFDVRGTAGRSVKCGWDKNSTRITLTDDFVRYSSTLVATRPDEPVSFYGIAAADNGLITGNSFQFANVQIEPGDTAHGYEPYKGVQPLAISSAGKLLGIPVRSGGNYTDANGQQWICDEVDFGRGVYVKRVNTKTLAEADIRFVNNDYVQLGAYVFTTVTDAAHKPSDIIVISDKLLGVSADHRTGSGYDDFYRCYAQSGVIYLRFPAGTGEKTLEECQTAFAGVTVQYALATPVETPLSEVELAAWSAIHSNKPSTTILNDTYTHMAAEYVADTKLYIDTLIKG